MITITLTLPLTTEEAQILSALLGEEAPVVEPVVVLPEPEPEEDLLGEPTLETAVARATALVSAGKATDVKAALEVAGVKRVSELAKPAAIKAFLDALDG